MFFGLFFSKSSSPPCSIDFVIITFFTKRSIFHCTGDAAASTRQQGANDGADGGEQDVKSKPRPPHRQREADRQVEGSDQGGRQEREAVHDRPRRVRACSRH